MMWGRTPATSRPVKLGSLVPEEQNPVVEPIGHRHRQRDEHLKGLVADHLLVLTDRRAGGAEVRATCDAGVPGALRVAAPQIVPEAFPEHLLELRVKVGVQCGLVDALLKADVPPVEVHPLRSCEYADLLGIGYLRLGPPRAAARLPARHSCADESVCKPGPVQGSVAGLPCATIPLRLPLPAASSGLPVNSGGPPSNVHAGPTRTPVPLDLAPGGVCIATPVTWGAGGLLHHRFTLTPRPEARGGLLSVALSRGSPRVGVTHHPALRSPDFPRRRRSVDRAAAVARPTHPRPQRSGGPDPRRPHHRSTRVWLACARWHRRSPRRAARAQ